GDGIVSTRFSGSRAAFGVAIQADGKSVVVGEGPAAGGFCVARYLVDGRLDRGFGGNGTGIVISGPMGGARAVALQPDGKIVVSGIGGDIFGPFALARYTRHGRLDRTFGGVGYVTLRMDSGEESGDALVIQADGKIVEAGYT